MHEFVVFSENSKIFDLPNIRTGGIFEVAESEPVVKIELACFSGALKPIFTQNLCLSGERFVPALRWQPRVSGRILPRNSLFSVENDEKCVNLHDFP